MSSGSEFTRFTTFSSRKGAPTGSGRVTAGTAGAEESTSVVAVVVAAAADEEEEVDDKEDADSKEGEKIVHA